MLDISEDAEPAEETAYVYDAIGIEKTIEALKSIQVKQDELQNQFKREYRAGTKSKSFVFALHAHQLITLLLLLVCSDCKHMRGPDNSTFLLWILGVALSRLFRAFTLVQSPSI